MNNLITIATRIDRARNDRDGSDFALDQHRESCPACHGMTTIALASGLGCEDGCIKAMHYMIDNEKLRDVHAGIL